MPVRTTTLRLAKSQLTDQRPPPHKARKSRLPDPPAPRIRRSEGANGIGRSAIVSRPRLPRSKAEFLNEIDAARRFRQVGTLFPWSLGEPQVFPLLYRVDTRAPALIRKAGGFLPNPSKAKTDLGHHIQNGGSGSYVSFSWEHNDDVLFNQHFFPGRPTRLIERGVPGGALSARAFEQLLHRRWPLDSSAEDRPTEALFETYEYRVKDLFGVPVLGGRFGTELEVTTLGANRAEAIEWRRIAVRTPIEYEPIDGRLQIKSDLLSAIGAIPRKQGMQVFDPPPGALEIGEWTPLAR